MTVSIEDDGDDEEPLGDRVCITPPIFGLLGSAALSKIFEDQSAKLAPLIAASINWTPPQIFESLLKPQNEALGRLLAPSYESFLDQYRRLIPPFLDNLPNLAGSMRGVWPANLWELDADDFDLEKFKTLMLDEHLPIAWVPRAATMKLVMAANTAGRRRIVYGQNWRGILQDCDELADEMTSTAVAPYVGFLKKSIAAVREGHHEGGQALAATTLDTVRTRFYGKNAYDTWIGNKNPIDPDELDVRTFFVICQLWGIHRGYRATNGDQLPTGFNRHGTVHAVSKQQYSRLNAVLGVAHLASLMWAQDSKFADRQK